MLHSPITLAPGKEGVVEVQWDMSLIDAVNQPALNQSVPTCILARFIADGTTPDPMTNEAAGTSSANVATYGNVLNCNNVSQLNTMLYEDDPNDRVPQWMIANVFGSSTKTEVHFDLNDSTRSMFQKGIIWVDLGRTLYQSWVNGGKIGSGIQEFTGNLVEGAYVPYSDLNTKLGYSTGANHTLLKITSPGAYIGNIAMSAKEQERVAIKMQLKNPENESYLNPYTIIVSQKSLPGGTTQYQYTGTVKFTGGRKSCPAAVISATFNSLNTAATLSVSFPEGGTASSYQWLKNGIAISGATGSTYSTSQGGDYTLNITYSSGCLMTSNILPVSFGASSQGAGARLANTQDGIPATVYQNIVPNPASEKASIYYGLGDSDKGTIMVVNIFGQVVNEYIVTNEGEVLNVDCSSYANGVYFCTLMVNGKVVNVQKLIVTK
jgi:hypothetical protein